MKDHSERRQQETKQDEERAEREARERLKGTLYKARASGLILDDDVELIRQYAAGVVSRRGAGDEPRGKHSGF